MVISVVTMFIDAASSHQRGKTYTRYLLRESYREDGKVKHRTIANLSHCSQAEIDAIKLALRHKHNLSALGAIPEISLEQGSRIGAVFCLNVIAHRLGIPQTLGSHRHGQLALWQILARLIDQGSRLSAVRLAQHHAACEVIGLDAFCEDHLYENLAWLAEHQEAIEMRLFQRRFGQTPPQLFLYDVTSTYLEGVDNILAAFGYNRDRKKGKQQLVIGLLAASDGTPVAVRVFEGNTGDTATVASQVRILAEKFGVEEVVLVGDRGMIKKKQIKLLLDADFHYITALTKPQIKKLLAKGVFQLGLFDDQLCEVSHESIRYVLRRNPVRQQEIAQSRDDRIKSLCQKAARETNYLTEHPKAKVETALKKLTSQRVRYGLADFVEILVTERTLSVVVDEEGKKTTSVLDGCYVITTDLSGSAASAEVIHDRYKDLTKVERAFRTWKTGHLELRPVHVRTEESTRGHVFVVMLAYLIERELEALWRNFDMTVPEAIDVLGSLRGTIVQVNQATCQKVPQPAGDIKKLLDAADIHLPGVLPVRSVKVATRRKLTTRRNKPAHQ